MTYDLIGVTGRKGAGKDTAISLLSLSPHEYGGCYALFPDGEHQIFPKRHVIKFAGPLKAMAKAHLAYCGVDYDMITRILDGDLKEVPNNHFCGCTPRWVQQKLGTEFGRVMLGDSIWLDAFEYRYETIKEQCRNTFPGAFVTDVRFPNERAKIKSKGGFILKIVDPNFEKPEYDHPSEEFIDEMEADLVIENNKSKISKDVFAIHVVDQLAKAAAI